MSHAQTDFCNFGKSGFGMRSSTCDHDGFELENRALGEDGTPFTYFLRYFEREQMTKTSMTMTKTAAMVHLEHPHWNYALQAIWKKRLTSLPGLAQAVPG